MKITLTRKRAIEIYTALERLSQCVQNVKIAYALARNRHRLRDEVEAVRAIPLPARFVDYEQKRIFAAQAHAIKDSAGRPLLENGQYILENPIEFQSTIDRLREEFKDGLDAFERYQAELKPLLDESIAIEFHSIPASALEAENAFALDAPPLALLIEPLLGYVIDD